LATARFGQLGEVKGRQSLVRAGNQHWIYVNGAKLLGLIRLVVAPSFLRLLGRNGCRQDAEFARRKTPDYGNSSKQAQLLNYSKTVKAFLPTSFGIPSRLLTRQVWLF